MAFAPHTSPKWPTDPIGMASVAALKARAETPEVKARMAAAAELLASGARRTLVDVLEDILRLDDENEKQNSKQKDT